MAKSITSLIFDHGAWIGISNASTGSVGTVNESPGW